jgi:C1A family cysteine protease
MPVRALGAIPDGHDPRDFTFEAQPQLMAMGIVPPLIDLRKWCSPVRDQGQQGSCTGFAIAVGLREFMVLKAGSQPVQLSPAFLYYQERVLERTIPDCQRGAMIRDGFKVLSKTGVCAEADDPYTDQACGAPAAAATADAAAQKIKAYHRILTLMGLKQSLAGGAGVVLGITVFDSFESPAALQSGHIPMPGSSEVARGGHALFCGGYKDDPQYAGGGFLIVKNSWGTGMFDKGYLYLPYAYVAPGLTSDMWTAN